MGWESQAVHLVPRGNLGQLLNHANDKPLIEALEKVCVGLGEQPCAAPAIDGQPTRADILRTGSLTSAVGIVATVAGFRAAFGSWPTHIEMPVLMAEAIEEQVLTPLGWNIFTSCSGMRAPWLRQTERTRFSSTPARTKLLPRASPPTSGSGASPSRERLEEPMWVFFRDAFLSVVDKGCDGATLLVRAPRRRDKKGVSGNQRDNGRWRRLSLSRATPSRTRTGEGLRGHARYHVSKFQVGGRCPVAARRLHGCLVRHVPVSARRVAAVLKILAGSPTLG